MADEQLFVDASAGFAFFDFVEALAGVGRPGGVGEDFEADCEKGAVGRQRERADVEWEIGNRNSLAAVDGDLPDLVAVAASGKEVDVRAVGRPAGAGAAGRVGGQAALPASVSVGDPDIVDALVGVEVGSADDEGGPGTGGVHLQIADPLHGHEVVDGEWAWGGRGGGESGRCQPKHNEPQYCQQAEHVDLLISLRPVPRSGMRSQRTRYCRRGSASTGRG